MWRGLRRRVSTLKNTHGGSRPCLPEVLRRDPWTIWNGYGNLKSGSFHRRWLSIWRRMVSILALGRSIYIDIWRQIFTGTGTTAVVQRKIWKTSTSATPPTQYINQSLTISKAILQKQHQKGSHSKSSRLLMTLRRWNTTPLSSSKGRRQRTLHEKKG